MGDADHQQLSCLAEQHLHNSSVHVALVLNFADAECIFTLC